MSHSRSYSSSVAGTGYVLRPLPTIPPSATPATPPPAVSRPLACKICSTHITYADATISGPRAFKGFVGKASLFTRADHVTLAPPVVQLFVTGAHVCQTACCDCCASPLGWKIVGAYQASEKWKEGTYLFELETLSEVSPR